MDEKIYNELVTIRKRIGALVFFMIVLPIIAVILSMCGALLAY